MSTIIVIPCYKVKKKISKVINKSLKFAKKIIIIDDKCPQQTGNFVKKNYKSKKILVLFNKKNIGVGGAVKRGYEEALKLKAKYIIKIDGDDQMNPKYIPLLLKNIKNLNADYCKGNRFFSLDIINKMPFIRLVGNFFLSIISMFSTGYWNIFDFTNGYTAISAKALKKLKLSKISNNFFFETDMIFYLYLNNLKVKDVKIPAIYNNSESNLIISKIFIYFIKGNIINFLNRIYAVYFKKFFFIKFLFIFFLLLFSYYLKIFLYFLILFLFIFFIIVLFNILYRKND